jgi:hypothetical protein
MITVAAALVSGIAVLLGGNLPWAAVLAPLNLRVLTSMPWAMVPMTAYLWVYWKYIGGVIGPPETSAWRRRRVVAHAPVAHRQAGVAGRAGADALDLGNRDRRRFPGRRRHSGHLFGGGMAALLVHGTGGAGGYRAAAAARS